MNNNLTLNYWFKYGWYVGKLKEIPNIYGQAKTLDGLELKIKTSYKVNFAERLRALNTVKMGS